MIKLNVVRDRLADALSLVAIASDKSSDDNPIHSFVHMVATEPDDNPESQGALHFHATNGRTNIVTSIPAEVIDSGDVFFPAKDFAPVLNVAKSNAVQIDQTSKSKIEYVMGRSKGVINLAVGDEFAQVPNGGIYHVILNAGQFRRALRHVVSAAAGTNSGNELLAGVSFRIIGDKMVLEATDSYRVAREHVDTEIVNAPLASQMIIPTDIVKSLNAFLRTSGINDSADVAMMIPDGDEHRKFEVSIGQSSFFGAVLEGRYPDLPLDAMIGRMHGEIIFNTKEFASTISVMQIYASDTGNRANLVIPGEAEDRYDDDDIYVTFVSISPEKGVNVRDTAARVTGPSVAISANFKLLQIAVGNITTENILMRYGSAESPLILSPFGKDVDPETGEVTEIPDSDFLYLVMPTTYVHIEY